MKVCVLAEHQSSIDIVLLRMSNHKHFGFLIIIIEPTGHKCKSHQEIPINISELRHQLKTKFVCLNADAAAYNVQSHIHKQSSHYTASALSPSLAHLSQRLCMRV